MKLERLELIHLRLPLAQAVETPFGRIHEHESVIVRAESSGAIGWGEAPAGAAPAASYETVHTVWHVTRDFLARKLKGAEIVRPGPIAELFSAVRGHPMAKAAIEMAVIDLLAKIEKRPLYQVLGGQRDEIPAGVSLGVEERLEDLLRRVEAAIAQGYQRIRVRIRPRGDIDVLYAIRQKFPSAPLTVDAGAAYSIADIEHLRKLDDYGLLMIEQPLDHDDLVDHARLQKELRTPLCLDDSIRSYHDARRAIEIGACRIICVKPPRLGGPYHAKMLHNVCSKSQIPVWCGGLLETGIGRAHNLALATLPNFSMPADIPPSDRAYREEIVDPPIVLTPGGTIKAPGAPGIGLTVLEDRVKKYTLRREAVL